MPDPDLVVRTSGEYRISNFLLWELAYAELVFTDVLWPDFRRAGPVRRRRRVPGPLAALRGARAVRPRRDGALGALGAEVAPMRWRLVGVALVLAFYAGLWVARRGRCDGARGPADRVPGPRPAHRGRQLAPALARDPAAARRSSRGRRATTEHDDGAATTVNTFRDEAIVLRTYKLAEADRICVLLTREHGKVRAVAHGVRKTLAAARGADGGARPRRRAARPGPHRAALGTPGRAARRAELDPRRLRAPLRGDGARRGRRRRDDRAPRGPRVLRDGPPRARLARRPPRTPRSSPTAFLLKTLVHDGAAPGPRPLRVVRRGRPSSSPSTSPRAASCARRAGAAGPSAPTR